MSRARLARPDRRRRTGTLVGRKRRPRLLRRRVIGSRSMAQMSSTAVRALVPGRCWGDSSRASWSGCCSVAAFVGGVVLGDVLEAIAILAIVVINGVIGFVQEWRAEDAMEALQKLAAPTRARYRGWKGGHDRRADLVPGDVMVLEAGDRLAADARVIEAMALSVDESALDRRVVPSGEGTPTRGPGIGRRRPHLDGVRRDERRGLAGAGPIVVGTGGSSEMGRIAGMLTEEEPPTPLQRDSAAIGRRVTLLAGVAAVVVLVVGLASGGHPRVVVPDRSGVGRGGHSGRPARRDHHHAWHEECVRWQSVGRSCGACRR